MQPAPKRLLSLLSLALPFLAGSAFAEYRDHRESRTETKRFTLAPVSGGRTLVVDNVIGSVDVKTGTGDVVELEVRISASAESAAELERAKREVELEVRESAGRLELRQGGSWRCESKRDRNERREDRDDDAGDCCCDRDDDRDYEVRFDWTLTVPRDLDLTVTSVNDGAIHVSGVNGRLKVRHVNDDVSIRDVAGRVDAKTVNGELDVEFRALPTGDSKFATVNGDIGIGFPKGLGAKLSFATLNGEVFTDFPYTLAANAPPPPPPPPAPGERGSDRKGRRHFGLGSRTSAVIGQGGFAIDCDTVNGDIRIRERG